MRCRARYALFLAYCKAYCTESREPDLFLAQFIITFSIRLGLPSDAMQPFSHSFIETLVESLCLGVAITFEDPFKEC